MRDFVRLQTSVRLRQLAAAVDRERRARDQEALHELRVTIRRLRRCLQVFAAFYPGNSWRHLRRRLSRLMEACAAVRDRDVAIGLLAEAGVKSSSVIARNLAGERRAAHRAMRDALRPWQRRRVYRHWTARLEV
jgi:CHAD domain-containing protein